MEAFATALQPVSEPNFIDNAFKEDPRGVTFRQWQPVETMLDSVGKHLESEEANNYGGSSQGSQTAMESSHCRMLSGGTAQEGSSRSSSVACGPGHDRAQVHVFVKPSLSCLQDKAILTEQATTLVPSVTCKTSTVRCKVCLVLQVDLDGLFAYTLFG